MLSFTNLSYKIGSRTLIEDASLNITDGWKVGVVGLNGTGKSTLFKMIAGELQPDSGSINITTRHRLGWVRQDMPETEAPLLDVVLAAHTELTSLWHAAETEADPNKLADIYHRLEDLDAYAAPAKASALLTGLGFKPEQINEPFSSFSGGWRMRVALAAALFVEPEILLLDEPTNHLDLEAIMWLEAYLASYPHTLLVISHDRELLNKCVTHVIHLDQKRLTLYTGNYDTFERERAARLGLQQKMHEKQMAERAHMQSFVDRFKAKASKARQAQSRMKALEKMDLVDAVIADRAVRFVFPPPDGKLGAPMISIDHADIGYVDGQPILRRVHENIDPDDRIALLGANGNGKSTLIKLIAGRLAAMKGEVKRAGKLRIGYFSQHQTDELDVNATPYQEMAALMRDKNPDVKDHVVRAKLAAFGFTRDLADNRIATLSGGEKARLLFAFMSFDGPHLLILDEPTNHLDIDAREALVQALNAYEGAIIIVSHDPTMVERVADRLWLVRDGAVQDFDGDLEDYRRFTIQAKRDAKRENVKENKDKKAKAQQAETAPVKSKPGKKELSKMEHEIARLTVERARLEALLADTAIYQNPKEASAVQADYQKVCGQLEQMESKWLAAHDDDAA